MTQWVRLMRRGARAAYRQLFPSPEVAAWRHARECARGVPRFTPGSIRMLDYELQYADLLSLCPEWHDIFVDGALEYRADSAAPSDPRLRRQCRSGQPVLQAPVSLGADHGV